MTARPEIEVEGARCWNALQAFNAEHPSLPSWAQAPEPRNLLLAIMAERPEATNDKCPNWGHRVTTYRSLNCTKLRLYYDRLCDEAIALDDDCFAAGRASSHFADIAEQERPDELVDRLLNEPSKVVPFTRMSWTDREDGSASVAA